MLSLWGLGKGPSLWPPYPQMPNEWAGKWLKGKRQTIPRADKGVERHQLSYHLLGGTLATSTLEPSWQWLLDPAPWAKRSTPGHTCKRNVNLWPPKDTDGARTAPLVIFTYSFVFN